MPNGRGRKNVELQPLKDNLKDSYFWMTDYKFGLGIDVFCIMLNLALISFSISLHLLKESWR